jgi:hypothetical protein
MASPQTHRPACSDSTGQVPRFDGPCAQQLFAAVAHAIAQHIRRALGDEPARKEDLQSTGHNPRIAGPCAQHLVAAEAAGRRLRQLTEGGQPERGGIVTKISLRQTRPHARPHAKARPAAYSDDCSRACTTTLCCKPKVVPHAGHGRPHDRPHSRTHSEDCSGALYNDAAL